MKARLMFGVLLLAVGISTAQTAPLSPVSKLHVSKAPDCPEGLGCQTFKQLWNGGDDTARTATWACFFQKDLTYPLAPEKDVVFFLKESVSAFEISYFSNGVKDVSGITRAEYSQGGQPHWKPLSHPPSLEVTKSGGTLTAELEFANAEQATAHFHLSMTLSSGRFESEWTTEKKGFLSETTSKEDYSGLCVLLPKTSK